MAKKSLPIAVFDSGMGGISVLKELVSVLPNENFIYFGDQANMPYGDYAAYGKSDYLKSLILADANFLLKNHAKSVVIACNTATAVCAEELRKKLL